MLSTCRKGFFFIRGACSLSDKPGSHLHCLCPRIIYHLAPSLRRLSRSRNLQVPSEPEDCALNSPALACPPACLPPHGHLGNDGVAGSQAAVKPWGHLWALGRPASVRNGTGARRPSRCGITAGAPCRRLFGNLRFCHRRANSRLSHRCCSRLFGA